MGILYFQPASGSSRTHDWFWSVSCEAFHSQFKKLFSFCYNNLQHSKWWPLCKGESQSKEMLQKKPQQTQRGQLVWARASSVVINSEDIVVIATCCILSCLIALLPVSPFPDILMERTPKIRPMKHVHAQEQHRAHTAYTHTQYTRHTDTRARHRARVLCHPVHPLYLAPLIWMWIISPLTLFTPLMTSSCASFNSISHRTQRKQDINIC